MIVRQAQLTRGTAGSRVAQRSSARFFFGDRRCGKLLILAAVGVLFSGLGLLKAADSGTKITIKGDGLCAKCALKEQPKCQNVVIVTKDGKETKYYLEPNDVAKKAHSKIGLLPGHEGRPGQSEGHRHL